MKTEEKIRLQRAGFEIGSVEEFLNLSEEENSMIEALVLTLTDEIPDHCNATKIRKPKKLQKASSRTR